MVLGSSSLPSGRGMKPMERRQETSSKTKCPAFFFPSPKWPVYDIQLLLVVTSTHTPFLLLHLGSEGWEVSQQQTGQTNFSKIWSILPKYWRISEHKNITEIFAESTVSLQIVLDTQHLIGLTVR